MVFTLGNLPVENFTLAIWPKTQGNQDHDLSSARTLMSPALTLVLLDRRALALDRDLEPIQLNHRRCLSKRLLTQVVHQRLDLIDPLIDGSQSNIASQLGTPPLADRTQTLTQTTTEEHVLLQIDPKSLKFLEDTEGANHIVVALLALQHGHLQMSHLSPSRLQIPSIISISRKLIGILASAISTLPVNLACLAPDVAIFSFFPS
jgi:hypothetical protein